MKNKTVKFDRKKIKTLISTLDKHYYDKPITFRSIVNAVALGIALHENKTKELKL